jgi:hypothetical protein
MGNGFKQPINPSQTRTILVPDFDDPLFEFEEPRYVLATVTKGTYLSCLMKRLL